jgi:hypothetical protein
MIGVTCGRTSFGTNVKVNTSSTSRRPVGSVGTYHLRTVLVVHGMMAQAHLTTTFSTSHLTTGPVSPRIWSSSLTINVCTKRFIGATELCGRTTMCRHQLALGRIINAGHGANLRTKPSPAPAQPQMQPQMWIGVLYGRTCSSTAFRPNTQSTSWRQVAGRAGLSFLRTAREAPTTTALGHIMVRLSLSRSKLGCSARLS